MCFRTSILIDHVFYVIVLLQSSNFVNPIYDAMYTAGQAGGSSSGKSEEKTGLLEHANEDIPSTGVDD